MKIILQKKIESIIEINNVSRKNKVIDIGCADVRPYSKYLIDYFDYYVGIDINVFNLNNAKEKKFSNKIPTFCYGNVEKLGFKNAEFDVVVCNNMLAYTNKKSAIEEMLRILKRGGIMISLFNNTIYYSIWKFFHRAKRGKLIEIVHSLIVILNTVFFRISRIKLFHTTYNTEKEIRDILNNLKYDIKYFIEEERNNLPYTVINFIIYKK